MAAALIPKRGHIKRGGHLAPLTGSFLDSVAYELMRPAGWQAVLWPVTAAKGAAMKAGRPVGRAVAGLPALPTRFRLLLAGTGAVSTGPQGGRISGLKAGALVGWEAMWLLAPSRAG
jgi:hypothetical protein